ncbi:MAG: menaquinone biosynthesis decarboxylase [Campylobacteraceae bacterium]|nr:menaquinone biosynthesis decarboxylase [Campylobacteraceae bacterium]
MNRWIKELYKNDELLIIDKEIDTYLEIAHASYLEMKKENPKALLFTNVVNAQNGIKYTTPVLTNVFGSYKKCKIVFGGEFEGVAAKIDGFLKLKKPKTLKEKIAKLKDILSLRFVLPKSVAHGECQEVIYDKDKRLDEIMPILTTWKDDGGPFITMGQVYTKSLDGGMRNVGMYRLQLFADNTLGLHWQIHKDSNHFFHEYKKAGQKMPVAIAIGGDPLYTWCATAPMPKGFFELMLYGLIRKKRASLVKCKSVDLEVPSDVDFVIEGYVDPTKLKDEGPFGDHTGYYTPIEPYPFLEISTITSKKNPIFYATVVGKPPIEDKYMGYATERIFLPLIKTTAPDIVDYAMPENGVFHNLILAKIETLYPGHAKQVMHAFWGVGQMSFVKHAIFVPKDAPNLRDYGGIVQYIAQRFDFENMLITEGILDALDHSSDKFAFGGKLGIDLTEASPKHRSFNDISNDELKSILSSKIEGIKELCCYLENTPNKTVCLKLQKKERASEIFERIKELGDYFKIIVLFDEKNNDLSNPYMLFWRVLNNIDAKRDLFLDKNIMMVDATKKTEIDGYDRWWPNDTVCEREVLENLKKKGIVEYDEEFLKKWQIVDF